ncbi:MAG: L-threonylcarbamoyladenylate synthase [candidate division Zixibacteria bacterium]
MSGKVNIAKFAKCVKKGDIMLFPTDTVIGIGCRFDSEEGIARLRAIKEIKESTPFAVLISSEKQLETLKVLKSRFSKILISRFWPGGLTIVMSSENSFPCCGEGNSVGLRMPDFDLLRKIIEKAGVPLAATSANFHGKPAPRKMEDVDPLIVEKADCVFDFPTRLVGIPSTVVKLEAGEPKILRDGAIPSIEILDAFGEAV